jgi:hypothetical protein
MQVTATLEASNLEGIRAAVGKTVLVKGRIQNVGATATNSIHFINFAGTSKGGFVGIVKQGDLPAITAALGADLKSALTGKAVELRGEIVLYKETPQIVITAPEQVKVVAQ